MVKKEFYSFRTGVESCKFVDKDGNIIFSGSYEAIDEMRKYCDSLKEQGYEVSIITFW